MVGERGFEPPTPWSRKRDSGVVLNVFNLLQWCFDRLSPARSPHSGVNVSPRMAAPHHSGAQIGIATGTALLPASRTARGARTLGQSPRPQRTLMVSLYLLLFKNR